MAGTELLQIPGSWNIRYKYTAGETISKFLTTLRDQARILATKCPKCSRVLVPPRSFCERCFVPLKDSWVEMAHTGTVESFTIVTARFESAPEPPYVLCFVKLDGASTSFPHFLRGLDLSNLVVARRSLKVGTSVRIVFKDRAERSARIDDFWVELA